MWDDIVIGKSQKRYPICSSIKMGMINTELYDDCDISQNVESYWISDCFLGSGMKIYKDTEEGKKLTELIETGKSRRINNFLDKMVLKHLSAFNLRKYIKREQMKAFTQGMETKAKEIRRALGVG